MIEDPLEIRGHEIVTQDRRVPLSDIRGLGEGHVHRTLCGNDELSSTGRQPTQLGRYAARYGSG